MTRRSLGRVAVAILLLLVPILLITCGGRESDTYTGPSRAEIKSIVRAELAQAPTPAEPGPSRAEVEQIVESAIAGIPEPAPGLTPADVGQIVQAGIAHIPTPASGLSRDDVEKILQESIEATLRPEQLTPEDVEKIIQSAIADMPEPGLSRADVEEAVQAAIQEAAEPEPSLTYAEVQRIARNAVASIPPRSAHAEYTKFIVDNAINRYETQGLNATLTYYNRAESVDGQWYVFIIDEKGKIIGHYDASRLGLDLNGWVGTDANGYNFGTEMLTATQDGKWVPYVYDNPETDSLGSERVDDYQLKSAWVVRHDGLLFGSGWYINADEQIKALVTATANRFSSVGLEATVAYFASPESVSAGLAATIDYYNNIDSVKGEWFAFIADRSGRIVAHYDPEMLGRDLEYLSGTDAFKGTEDGSWVTTEDTNPSTSHWESMRIWVVSHDGMTFGSGWYYDGTS